jgi:hypothetical protein
MPNHVTLVLTPSELEYLLRAVDRDLEDFDSESMRSDMEEYAVLEAHHAAEMLRLLQRVSQEQVYTH